LVLLLGGWVEDQLLHLTNPKENRFFSTSYSFIDTNARIVHVFERLHIPASPLASDGGSAT
jgi:hypothetical protein